jgi:hypothetical protein
VLFLGLILVLSCVFRKKNMVIIKQRYKKNKIKKVISFFFISKRTFSLFRIQSAPENNKKKKKKISQAI